MILRPEDCRQMEFSCRADLVWEEPLVLLVDEVVASLDLGALYGRYSEGGRSFYDPGMQMKVLFFGYCDGIRSCRELARHIRYDIRYRYYCGSLRPDFRTINRFRKDNLDLLGDYFAQIVLMCQDTGLLDTSLLALDGTKILASASGRRRGKKGTRNQLAQHFHGQLQEDIISDGVDDDRDDGKDDKLFDDNKSISSVDPDARFMKISGGNKRLGYNSQVMVDKNQLIVAADVSNNADDSVQFQPMMEQCRQMFEGELDKVSADGGYYSGENLKYASEAGIDLYLPVTKTGRVPDDGFHRDRFVYDRSSDSYLCPAGERLHYQSSRVRRGVKRKIYKGRKSSCGCCRFRSLCTKSQYRTLEISENYVYEQEMKTKMRGRLGRLIYRQRKCLVEPVFGNMKFNLGFMRYGLRTLNKVRGEFFLICIAHNLKKLARYKSPLRPKYAASLTRVIMFSLPLTLFRSIWKKFQHYQQGFRFYGIKPAFTMKTR
jgi:transposase